MKGFEVLHAKEIGNTHYLARSNCQDALEYSETEDRITGVVCDGCSAKKQTEVAAILAARIVNNSLRKNHGHTEIAERIKIALLEHLGPLAHESPDLFLFNIVAFCIESENTTILRLGDGTVIINGSEEARSSSRYFEFQNPENNAFERWEIPTASFESLLIATDGAREFDWRHEQLQADGQALGRLEDLLLLNQDRLTAKLQSAQQIFRSDGSRRSAILQDDLALIIVRRV